jgi:hypothetical protein
VRTRRLSVTIDEAVDAIAASRFARALRPLATMMGRNAALTLYWEQTRILSLAFKYAESESVKGDYAEFGIWTGRTFVEACRIAPKYGVPRRFVAFDSFEGLPTLHGPDVGGPFATGDFKNSRAEFEARLRRARVPMNDVTIVEGWFDDTLAHPEQIHLESVAVAWIDCDLYASTTPVLDYLTSRISPGSVLLFDDWYTFRASPHKGEMRACAEWLERNPSLMITPWRPFHFAGQSFIVQRVAD